VISLRRNHFLLLSALYALAMIYLSLVLGPAGLHYVPLGLGEAWDKFLGVRFVHHASNQRPDWIANMLLPVPLAYMLNSAFGFGLDTRRRVTGIAASLAISVFFVLAVKYAQLFFPPRTVTLNYITAQLIGTVLGVVTFQLSHTRLYPRLAALFEDGDGLTIVLGAYTVWLISYYLMPFDFTLSVGDLAGRALELFDILGSTPGEGHPATYQLLLVVADTASAIPVGMYLAVRGRQRTTRRLVIRAFGVMFLIFIAQLFVMGAEPLLLALVYRTAGAVVGVLFMQKIKGKDLRKRHYYFSRYLPFAVPVYLILVMFVSGLLTSQWSAFDEAGSNLETRQFLPFWNFYIVSKAHATQSLVVGAFIYAPIGVMVWLRRGFWSSGAKFSAFLAFGLSLLMELGRMVKPGLRPDFSDPIIAAVAAAAAFKAMPILWRMFEREAAKSGTLDSYIAEMQYAAAMQPEAPPEEEPLASA
jgi:VanZ family protein